MDYFIYFRVSLLLTGINVALCFMFIPERAKVEYINSKYAEDVVFTVKRYGRKSAYYMNLEWTSLHTWVNNVSIHLFAYEFLHNEYRRSFVELHYKICDFLTKDPFVSETLTKTFGMKCPITAGQYKLMNITLPTQNFPNVFPFEKGRVYATFEQNENGDIIAKGHLDALFKAVQSKTKGKE